MQTTDILITNILSTGTGFAVLADDMNQNVFVPAKVLHGTSVRQGDRVAAMLVPNQVKPDKTPWVAIQINDVQPAPQSNLGDKIRWELANGPATAFELAKFIGAGVGDVQVELARMKLPHTDLYALEMVDLLPEGDE
jgi:hypothetical protein